VLDERWPKRALDARAKVYFVHPKVQGVYEFAGYFYLCCISDTGGQNKGGSAECSLFQERQRSARERPNNNETHPLNFPVLNLKYVISALCIMNISVFE
jgi:hypothetical protein